MEVPQLVPERYEQLLCSLEEVRLLIAAPQDTWHNLRCMERRQAALGRIMTELTIKVPSSRLVAPIGLLQVPVLQWSVPQPAMLFETRT